MASTSLRNITNDRWDFLTAQHLLNRAGFGGSPRQIQALVAMGPIKAVDYLVDYDKVKDVDLPKAEVDPDIMRPPTAKERDEYRKARRSKNEKKIAEFQAKRMERQRADRKQLRDLRFWWIERMVRTARPLREKLTLLWHGHFAVNYRACEDSYLLYQQNQFFRDNANGSFEDLAVGIVKDPAMHLYLDNQRNTEGRPNENLARELMELFTLGAGHYTEQDIKEAARALTGYTRKDNDFHFNKYAHDAGTKTIFGKRGNFDGEQFAQLCLTRPACPRFVAFKLYKHFVADVEDYDDMTRPQQTVVEALGREIRKHRFKLAPVLRTLLLSEHFYDDSIRGAKIKSPIELVVGLVRMLETPARDRNMLADAMRVMGQEVLNPPNVAGWPGGKTWINTSTLFIRQNLATYLITGKPPFNTKWTKKDISYDATRLISSLRKPDADAVIDYLCTLLLGGATTEGRKKQLRKFMADHQNRITNDTLIAMLCLITAAPEFQLC
jgi:uncharacterized protein (DUF1800 family)